MRCLVSFLCGLWLRFLRFCFTVVDLQIDSMNNIIIPIRQNNVNLVLIGEMGGGPGVPPPPPPPPPPMPGPGAPMAARPRVGHIVHDSNSLVKYFHEFFSLRHLHPWSPQQQSKWQ
jgi:hypothetical protein